MDSKYKNINLNIDNKVAVLKFNRPEQLNAMNRQMMDEIIDGIVTINNNEDVKVAVITGSGRAFMAGADIKEYGSQTEEQFRSFQETGITLYEAIENAPKPWIAAVNGFALGGGFEIALACDLILASENAKMGLPEVFLSLIPGGGGTQRLIQKIGVNRVREMLFLGGQYSSEQLHAWGIVNQIVPDGEFDETIWLYAEKLSRRSPSAIKQLKKLVQLSLTSLSFDQKIQEEAKTVTKLFYSPEAKKAIQDFIEKT
ncbi:enoyl-CoA hydratase/enoyl-CoA hydratase/3-hydroxypropionyl-coenzyme A dehydratase [Arenibacter algicola]|uniref:Enoyl-CoA hydratase/enoyl-CoA hydratase/3-hydroxypropionyl-coenzyme A dehydratase n=1 Tax=Arenibacter algicola TaxID=616991 RepID=A0ABY3ADH8_9FLAO|tara:strand:+ start:39548 stop:40315 length:768 start_codon:yes stop_codon:yes gene_type:complete